MRESIPDREPRPHHLDTEELFRQTQELIRKSRDLAAETLRLMERLEQAIRDRRADHGEHHPDRADH